MNLKREQEFVSQYHFDARNFEWENENGAYFSFERGSLVPFPQIICRHI